MTDLIRLLAILGPTATGKSRLAIELAERIGGEIVNADSRQVYRGMDIGTAKPAAEDRRRAPHHLFDLIVPDEPFSIAQYLALARTAIAEIAGRGGAPILVGGSGLYVRAVLDGLAPPVVPPDPALRATLEARAAAEGSDVLMAELMARDPVAAARIDPRNVRRIVRALEVVHATGRPFSDLGTVEPPPYAAVKIGLTLPRAELYRRIDERVDEMIASGLVEEVKGLIAAGYGADLPAMSSIGYREIASYLEGGLSLSEAVARIKFASHRFARRQYTWFRLDDPSIVWLPAGDPDLVDAALDIWRR
jgi:tRNA dimethylallyltransferase